MENDMIWEAQKNIRYIISNVAAKESADIPLEIDQFAELRKDRRIRDAQIEALYEQYFLPERHETDWQMLSEIVHTIVNTVISSPGVDFVALAVANAVVGNAAYDLLKNMCSYVATLLEEKLGEKAITRASSFKQIGSDAESLKSFFQKNPKARIEEIERETGISRERIHPLLKLAGFNHYRRGTPCYWELP
jgi:hypothetical protein